MTFKIYFTFFSNFKWEICFISLQYTQTHPLLLKQTSVWVGVFWGVQWLYWAFSARDGMTLGHHLAAGGYNGTDWGLCCTLTLGFFWSTVRETGCDRVRGNGRRGIGPTDRPFWQRLALPEQMEREREAHRCDIDPMGLVLPVLICERKMSMFELLMKAPSCPRLLGHYQKKSEFLVPLYITVRSCVTLPVISTSDRPLSICWCLYSRHTKHDITFSIWQALIWLADCTHPLVVRAHMLMPLWCPLWNVDNVMHILF